MAGDWIKMRSNLWDDPRVGRLIDLTDSSEAPIIGALYWLWSTADQHTEDGFMPGLTLRQIDRKTGVQGFAQALVEVGWLIEASDGVVIVRFDEHNGASAKRRCSDAQRKANSRSVSASDADNARTESGQDAPDSGQPAELEKEKEKSNTSPSLRSGETRGKRAAPESIPAEELIAAGFDAKSAEDFIAHKARLKAPLTARAWADHKREAFKAGWTVVQAAEKVMAKGWKGFEAKYVERESPPGRAPPPESFRERDQRLAAERVAAFTGRPIQPRNNREIFDVEVTDVTPARLG